MDEITDTNVVGRYVGQVKWWNDTLGFGFATIIAGPKKDQDVFVHHSGIRTRLTNYRTLCQGEYVCFDITNSQNGVQAIGVTGVCGGSLMCEQTSWRRPSGSLRKGGSTPHALTHSASSGVLGCHSPDSIANGREVSANGHPASSRCKALWRHHSAALQMPSRGASPHAPYLGMTASTLTRHNKHQCTLQAAGLNSMASDLLCSLSACTSLGERAHHRSRTDEELGVPSAACQTCTRCTVTSESGLGTLRSSSGASFATL